MKKKLILVTLFISISLSLLFSNELTNLISMELQKMYNSNFELSIGSNTCNVGTFTWEESGVGTSFSSYIQNSVQDAVVDTKSFDLILSDVMPVFGPDAAKILSQNKEMKLGAFLVFGTYSMEGPSIKLNLKIFSNAFSKVMAETEMELPMGIVPLGMQVIPTDIEKIENMAGEIDNLYGKSELDIYVTTSRGDGAVFRENEYMKIYLLSSENCYIKMYLIGVDGNTVQIFPNQYEKNNFLPGKQMLQFPGKTSPFKFQLVPPFGTETIKVIASTRQFTDVITDFKDLGMATRGIFIKETESEEQETMAEAKILYTILPE
ncbi:MAG: DUF4384 domain-containing protein [Spirochaetales bacterium]|nr:DUF4384 domain-containing protein [Spirochaetales bacterium]